MAEEVLKAPGDARRRRYVATSRRTAVERPVAPFVPCFLQLAKTSYPVQSFAAVREPTSHCEILSGRPRNSVNSLNFKIAHAFKPGAVMLHGEDG
jgi:hypothetical protein